MTFEEFKALRKEWIVLALPQTGFHAVHPPEVWRALYPGLDMPTPGCYPTYMHLFISRDSSDPWIYRHTWNVNTLSMEVIEVKAGDLFVVLKEDIDKLVDLAKTAL